MGAIMAQQSLPFQRLEIFLLVHGGNLSDYAMSLKWKEISLLIEEARPVLVGSALQKVAQAKELAAGESFLFQGFGHGGSWRLWSCLLQDQSCWVLAGEDWKFEAQPEPS